MAKEEAPRDVYQFHILLLKISPAIWRRVLVPSSQSLADFHATLQMVMGWDDTHQMTERHNQHPNLNGLPWKRAAVSWRFPAPTITRSPSRRSSRASCWHTFRLANKAVLPVTYALLWLRGPRRIIHEPGVFLDESAPA